MGARGVAVLCGLGWALAAARADATPEPARLVFHRGGGAASCPDEAALRSGVAARLGVDPFVDDAARTIVVRIDAGRVGLEASIEVVQPNRHARRTLRAAGPACGELGAAVELALSLAIDPTWQPARAPAPAAPAEPSEPAAPSPRLPVDSGIIVTDEELPVERPQRAGPWRLGVGSFATFGSSPDLVVGVRVELGVRGALGSLSLEPWLTLPAATSAPGGRVSMTTVAASLVACRPVVGLELCAEASGGVFQAVGQGAGFIMPTRAVSPFIAGGGRAQWTVGLGAALDLHVSFDLLVPLVHTRLSAQGDSGEIQAWTTPYVMPSIGLGLAGHFG